MAQQYNFTINKNEYFSKRIVWKGANGQPINLTNCTAKLQGRLKPGAPVLFELSTENGGIELGGIAGTVDLKVLPSRTKDLVADEMLYDLKVYFPGNQDRRLLSGTLQFSDWITE